MKPLSVVNNNDTRILWNGPKELAFGFNIKKIYSKIFHKVFKETDFAVTDLSHSRAIIEIEGTRNKRGFERKGVLLIFIFYKKIIQSTLLTMELHSLLTC